MTRPIVVETNRSTARRDEGSSSKYSRNPHSKFRSEETVMSEKNEVKERICKKCANAFPATAAEIKKHYEGCTSA